MYCLLRFVFSVNFALIRFATGVSARRIINTSARRIFYLECFYFVKVSGNFKRSVRKKFNSSLSEWPMSFSYLFVLLNGNRVHLILNSVSLKLKRKKRKEHTQKWVFQHEILKLIAKRFKKAFYLSGNCYSLYWILQLLINLIHQSDIYLVYFN